MGKARDEVQVTAFSQLLFVLDVDLAMRGYSADVADEVLRVLMANAEAIKLKLKGVL